MKKSILIVIVLLTGIGAFNCKGGGGSAVELSGTWVPDIEEIKKSPAMQKQFTNPLAAKMITKMLASMEFTFSGSQLTARMGSGDQQKITKATILSSEKKGNIITLKTKDEKGKVETVSVTVLSKDRIKPVPRGDKKMPFVFILKRK